MRRKISAFNSGAIQHIYQRAKDHGVIFYTIEDRLVYYTLAAANAKRHRLVVFSASIMYTHLHQGVSAPSLAALRQYLHDTNTAFVRLYNARHSRQGPLLDRKPGRSQKATSKEKRSNCIYIFNNHVEKKLCRTALKERWSFLAYAFSDHPFSVELKIKKASATLRKAVRLVNRRIRKGKGLEYCDLERILPNLDIIEREQFIDYTISSYAWIDFRAATSLFGSLEALVTSVNSTTGGEYAINEDYSPHSDTAYSELIELSETEGFLSYLFRLSPSEISEFANLALKRTSATFHHIAKFFHLAKSMD